VGGAAKPSSQCLNWHCTCIKVSTRSRSTELRGCQPSSNSARMASNRASQPACITSAHRWAASSGEWLPSVYRSATVSFSPTAVPLPHREAALGAEGRGAEMMFLLAQAFSSSPEAGEVESLKERGGSLHLDVVVLLQEIEKQSHIGD